MGPIMQTGRNVYDVRRECDRERDGQLAWVDAGMNLLDEFPVFVRSRLEIYFVGMHDLGGSVFPDMVVKDGGGGPGVHVDERADGRDEIDGLCV
ncbi:hypothetical protein VTO73DRAFT_11227 [Trametes versicolor]